MDRLQTAAVDQAFHGIEEFHPIFQRRFGHDFPLVKAFGAVREFPFATHALRGDLEFLTFLGDPFPTDFGFGHVLLSLRSQV